MRRSPGSRWWTGGSKEGYAIGLRGLEASNAVADEGTVAARCALWAGDLEVARDIADRMHRDAGHGRAIDAVIRGIDAGVMALDGRTEDAVAAYDQALRELRALNVHAELALCELDFVRFVGGERPEVRAAAEEARSIFDRIPSPPFLRRLDEALGMPAR